MLGLLLVWYSLDDDDDDDDAAAAIGIDPSIGGVCLRICDAIFMG